MTTPSSSDTVHVARLSDRPSRLTARENSSSSSIGTMLSGVITTLTGNPRLRRRAGMVPDVPLVERREPPRLGCSAWNRVDR